MEAQCLRPCIEKEVSTSQVVLNDCPSSGHRLTPERQRSCGARRIYPLMLFGSSLTLPGSESLAMGQVAGRPQPTAPERVDYLLLLATSETFYKNLAVVSFTYSEARVPVIVRRAARHPTVTGLPATKRMG